MGAKGGKKMQTIFNPTKTNKGSKASPADRFEARLNLAKYAMQNVEMLNADLCKRIIREATKDVYGKRKK